MSNDKQFKDVTTLHNTVNREVGHTLGTLMEMEQFKGFELQFTVWAMRKVFTQPGFELTAQQIKESDLAVCTDKWMQAFRKGIRSTLDDIRHANPVDILMEFDGLPITPLHLWVLCALFRESMERTIRIVEYNLDSFDNQKTEQAVFEVLAPVKLGQHELLETLHQTDKFVFEELTLFELTKPLEKEHPMGSKVIFNYALTKACCVLLDNKYQELRKS